MSGVDLDGRSIRKGAADAIRRWIEDGGGTVAGRARRRSSSGSRPRAGRRSSSPSDATALGVVHLKDVVKEGMRERFDAAAARWASAR